MRNVAVRLAVCLLLTVFTTLTFGNPVFAADSNAPAIVQPVEPEKVVQPDSGRAGFGVHVGLNGIGFETATRISHKSNLRGGMDFFPGIHPNFTYNDIHFKSQLDLKTVKVQYDFFPRAGGFHISPGVLISMGNLAVAKAQSTPGEYFGLGGNSYLSDPANPVKGSMKINFSHRVSPMFTVGFGNLVSRKEGKHFTVPFEAGLAFTGAPKSVWGYSGNVCTDAGCGPASANHQFQADVLTEQTNFNKDAAKVKVYPIVSIGIGYKF